MKTTKEKVKSLRDEVKFRQRCYPYWVKDGRITELQMQHEIACMKEILQDYENQLRLEQRFKSPKLFEEAAV